MDTLAVRLTIPLVGFVGDFHSLVRAPCRAHIDKKVARMSYLLYCGSNCEPTGHLETRYVRLRVCQSGHRFLSSPPECHIWYRVPFVRVWWAAVIQSRVLFGS